MFDDSDNIATSLKVGLPANRKGRRRSKVKNRLSYDDRLLDVSTDGDSSRENSRGGFFMRYCGETFLQKYSFRRVAWSLLDGQPSTIFVASLLSL